MQFLIQCNLMIETQLVAVANAVKPYPHQFVGVIPFSHDITSEHAIIGEDYIPYGSTLFTTLAYERKWKGLHFNLDTFNYHTAIHHRNDMLNAEHVLPAREVSALMRSSVDTQQWFVRPSYDLKHFSGQVIGSLECANWLDDAMSLPIESGSYAIDPEMMIVVATPKEIKAEWRWFIIGGKVVDGAMYRRCGQLIKNHETDQSVIAEAQLLADSWLPDACCVMDTALTADDQLKVCEFNCINSSGFYGHDVDKIFTYLWEYHS